MTRTARVRLLAGAAAALDIGALGLPWLRPDLAAGLSAADLPLRLPGLGTASGASWAAVAVALAVLCAAVTAVPGRYQAVAARTAALVSGTAAAGFLLIGSFADFELRQQLVAGADGLDTMRRIVGYRIPRPAVSALGPVELPTGAALLVSALRTGFLLFIAATALICLAARIAGRAHGRGASRAIWVPRVVVAAVVVLVGLVGAQAWRADWLAGRAQDLLTAGRLPAARVNAAAAIAANPTLQARPDVVQLLGDVAAATATGATAQQLSGRSSVAADSGRWDDALALAVHAAAAVPDQPAYRAAVCQQATARAASAAGIDPVRAEVPVSMRCDLALLQLSESEITAGRYDLVLIDAAQLTTQTPDQDVRSAALTMIARAQLATGDVPAGRRVLQQALAADPDDLNVVARALATGLYSAER